MQLHCWNWKVSSYTLAQEGLWKEYRKVRKKKKVFSPCNKEIYYFPCKKRRIEQREMENLRFLQRRLLLVNPKCVATLRANSGWTHMVDVAWFKETLILARTQSSQDELKKIFSHWNNLFFPTNYWLAIPNWKYKCGSSWSKSWQMLVFEGLLLPLFQR